jgi:putative ABC transport system permease protein
VLEGRDFTPHDTIDAPLVAIVSEAFARVLAGDGSSLGLRITEVHGRGSRDTARAAEIVGVVPDVVTHLSNTQPLLVYFPAVQQQLRPMRTVYARARFDTGIAERELLASVRTLDPRLTPEGVSTIEARLALAMAPHRFARFVLGAFGTMTILLAMLGAYVTAASMASRRQRELGIRAALGSSRLRLGGLVLGEAARLVGAGVLAGLLLSWMAARAMRSFLFGIEPLDPATFLGVTTAVLVVTLAVSLGPAIDAARVDLVRTLREE